MNAYIAALRAAAEKQRLKDEAACAERGRLTAQAARDRLVPLEARLGRLLSGIPAEVQKQGLSLPTLQGQLRARGRDHARCHVGELGLALRRLGFRRERRWRGDSEAFQALWLPK